MAHLSKDHDGSLAGQRSKYHKRKLSHLERPTQLEIGGEGSPMLSLLPPLKTRDISPRFNFTVGKHVKDQKQQQSKTQNDEKLGEGGRAQSRKK